MAHMAPEHESLDVFAVRRRKTRALLGPVADEDLDDEEFAELEALPGPPAPFDIDRFVALEDLP